MPACLNCGAPYVEGDAFCGTCGADVRRVVQNPAPVAPTQVMPVTPPPSPEPPPFPADQAGPPQQGYPPPAPGQPYPAAYPPVEAPPKKSNAGLVIGIVVAVVVLCGVGTAAAGFFGWRQYQKSATAGLSGPTSSATQPADKPSATPAEPPASPPAAAPGVAPDESTPSTPLDEKSAAALVEQFLGASQKDDVATARSLIAPPALERLGGEPILKQKGVITGWKVAKITGGDGVWDVLITIESISGPENWRFTVGMDGSAPKIADINTLDF
jgi:hypothetical protein